MRRFIIFSLCQLLIFVAPLSNALATEPSARDSLHADSLAGIEAGRSAAKQFHGETWLLGGFLGGLVAGPIGTGLTAGISQIGTPQPPPTVQ